LALDISISEKPDAADLEKISQGLNEHSNPITIDEGFRPLVVFARDADGALRGGAVGKVNWNWLHVSLLWVDESLRQSGTGSKLMTELENAARERGCEQAHLDTFSYQAKPFYEGLGYAEFARLEDYPPGHTRFFLRKTLAPSEAN